MKELLVKCGAYKHNEEEINFSKNYDDRYLVNDHFDHWFIGADCPIRVRFTHFLGQYHDIFNTYQKVSYVC